MESPRFVDKVERSEDYGNQSDYELMMEPSLQTKLRDFDKILQGRVRLPIRVGYVLDSDVIQEALGMFYNTDQRSVVNLLRENKIIETVLVRHSRAVTKHIQRVLSFETESLRNLCAFDWGARVLVPELSDGRYSKVSSIPLDNIVAYTRDALGTSPLADFLNDPINPKNATPVRVQSVAKKGSYQRRGNRTLLGAIKETDEETDNGFETAGLRLRAEDEDDPYNSLSSWDQERISTFLSGSFEGRITGEVNQLVGQIFGAQSLTDSQLRQGLNAYLDAMIKRGIPNLEEFRVIIEKTRNKIQKK